jgi:hypothetical protein
LIAAAGQLALLQVRLNVVQQHMLVLCSVAGDPIGNAQLGKPRLQLPNRRELELIFRRGQNNG